MATERQVRSPLAESLLARLKAETAEQHARIEELLPLMRPDLDRSGYRAYLARLLGFLGPLEARLAAYAGGFVGLDFAARRKRDLVASDLVALGATAADIGALTVCRALPALGTLEEAWGCLYVQEGSTLGGQIILRTLGPRLGLSAGHGLGFLVGYGEKTGSSWKAFAAAITAFDGAGCDRDAVVRGACETFATQTDWLAGKAETALG